MDAFEQALLSHTKRCYSAALALTRNPDRAQNMARHVITEAWQLRDSANGGHDIKKRLLTALRKEYLKDQLDVRAVGKEVEHVECT